MGLLLKHESTGQLVWFESIYYIIIRENKKEEINGGTDAENESALVEKESIIEFVIYLTGLLRNRHNLFNKLFARK
jgi:hypothetical protein